MGQLDTSIGEGPEVGLTGNCRTLMAELSAARRRQLARLVLMMPLTAAAETLLIAAVVPFISFLSAPTGHSASLAVIDPVRDALDLSTLQASVLLLAAATLLAATLRLTLAYSTQDFAHSTGHELAVAVYDRLLRQPYLFHVSRNSGSWLAAQEKIDDLVHGVLLQGLQAIGASLIAVAVLGALLWIDAIAGIAAAALLVALYGAMLLLARRRLAAHSHILATMYDARLQALQESSSGIRDVIIDRTQDAHVEHFTRIDRSIARARLELNFLAAAPRFIVEAAGLIVVAMVALMLANRAGGFSQSLPLLAALAVAGMRLMPLGQQLYNGWANLFAYRPVIGQIASLLRLPKAAKTADAAPPSFQQAIRLDQVCLRYPDRDKPALRDIDLTIRRGERVAMVGKSGSGKSTLADLVMGLIEPTGGQVTVDGKGLTGSVAEGWRSSIAHVPQAVFLADASIAINIALSDQKRTPDPDRVRRAAELAQIAPFIETLPDRYDTIVGERGLLLSGGQRQRLALARAYYKDAPLLVLDEATSALDDETEAAVLDALRIFSADQRTVVIIAHRQTMLAHCDRVIRLVDGRIVD